MTELERIKDQLTRSYAGVAWAGASVLDVLNEVPAGTARAHPLPDAHSIWEIVLHMIATQNLVQRRLKGDNTPMTDEEDWPAVTETSEAAWQKTREDLAHSYERLQEAISGVDDSRLDAPILLAHSTIYITLHGVVQHNLYHLGQIALLKKSKSG
jgi:uncharacterized damage-inducible protein DinB